MLMYLDDILNTATSFRRSKTEKRTTLGKREKQRVLKKTVRDREEND